LRALGDKSRWRICQILLAHGEVCVGELVDKMKISQPLVSHHLKALRQVGLVKTRRQGNWIFYSLAPRRLERVIARLNAEFGSAMTSPARSKEAVIKG
jgi:DNA-binding transcriptional ArsR family regulator